MTLILAGTGARRSAETRVAQTSAPRRGGAPPLASPAPPPELPRALRWLLGSGAYAATLGRRAPGSFFAVAPDPWPGDAEAGRRLLEGEFVALGRGDHVVPGDGDPAWSRTSSDPGWRAALNSFEWLRDLRESGEPAAAAHARALIEDWIATQWRWSPLAWRRDVLATRMVAWIRHYDFLSAGADAGFAGRFVGALARQRRQLLRASGRAAGAPRGREAVLVLKAIAFADLAFSREGPRFAKSLDAALQRLGRHLKRYVLHDGVVSERAPQLQLAVLRDLVDLRAALSSADLRAPPEMLAAIDRLAPALRFFRHGDGGLALFNGAAEGDRATIDLVLARSGSADPPPPTLPVSGFQRLAAGTSLVLVDAGSPPGRGLDADAHAGTLSFEMSAAHERLIVNCGSHPSASPDWRFFMRYTAAHSTAVVDDTNSSEVTAEGALEYRAGNVLVERADRDGAHWLDMSHDGYRSLYGIVHRRRLWLSPDGGDLRGEDGFAGHEGRPVTVPDRRFILRFHLHPAVKATLAQSGQAVLMRLPSGRGWRLRASGAGIGLAESVYLASGERLRRTEQIVLVGQVPREGTTVKWALTRMEG